MNSFREVTDDLFSFFFSFCQIMEEALIFALKDMLGESCTEDVANAWREFFQSMAGTMLAAKKQAQENHNLLV